MSRKKEAPVPISISYPHVASEWHPTRNGDLTPDKISAGVTRKVWWLCPRTCPEGCVHEWEAFVGNRCRGSYGCPFCSRLTKRVCVHTSIVATHPEIAAQWHPTRNEGLRPENFSYGSEKQVWWLCPRTCPEGCAHEWKADISKRILRGEDAGCPYCATNHKKVCYHSSLAHLRPDIAAEWDYERNGDLKPDTITVSNGRKVWWKCSTPCEYGCAHEWQARVSDRLTTGCPHCNRTHVCFHQSISFTHPEIVEEWHPTKNNELDPTKISYGSSKRVWWRCRYNSDHEWITAISNRCSGGKSECPYCLNKTERKVFEYLTGMGMTVQRQFKIKTCKRVNYLPFDLCVPEYKTIIEIDGAQHFKTIRNWMPQEETLQRDIFKMQQAEKEGYRVIRVFQELVFKESTEWMKVNLYDEIISGEYSHKFIANDTTLYDKHRELYNTGEIIELV